MPGGRVGGRVTRVAVAIGATVAVLALAGCGSGSSGGVTKASAPGRYASMDGKQSPTTAPTTTTAKTTDTMADGMAMGPATTGAKRPTNVAFDGPTRSELGRQLVEARAVALRYPTVKDALAAGYRLTTPYAPGTGAHYGKDSATQPPGKALDVEVPQSILYDGTEPGSKVVGLMYVQLGGKTAPDGFAGPLDTWNAFPGQCLETGTTDPVFPTKSSVTKAECTKAHGTFLDITAWIQHVWVVPGWEAPGGVFAAYNDDIVCADGGTSTGPKDGCPAPALAAPTR